MFSPFANAQIEEAIALGRLSMEMEPGEISVEGAEFLLDEAERAKFFLVGESHGNQQTPGLVQNLLADLKPRGYSTFAMEIGPASAGILSRSIDAGGLNAAMQLCRETPMSIAFLNWTEEIDLAVDAREQGYRIWGLDQEFIASPRLLLSRLVELAEGAESRELAEEWLQRATVGFAEFAKTGDQSTGFMVRVQPADFDALDAAFAQESEEARWILRELRASAVVYRHYQEGRFFMNNVDRIKLMKRHLHKELQDLGEQEKVLFKFGAAHMYRGYSPYNQLDLGNAAAEMAFAGGSDSFHLMVFAQRSIGADDSGREFVEGSPHFKPFYEVAGEDIAVYDLRPLRRLLASDRARKDQAALHQLVFGFDALLLFPDFDAATELVKMNSR
jgi:hypothetical protein